MQDCGIKLNELNGLTQYKKIKGFLIFITRMYLIFFLFDGEQPLHARVKAAKAQFKRRTSHAPNLTCELSTLEARHLNQFGSADSIRRGNQLWIGRSCRAARLKHGLLSNVELFMCRTLCIIYFLSHNSLLCR